MAVSRFSTSKLSDGLPKYQSFRDASAFTPDEVTSGLTLKLDAGNSSSYGGSGSTWYDISGNSRNATLSNSPSFTSNGSGSYFTFNGSNQKATGTATGISGNAARTIGCWFSMDAGTNDKIPFALGNSSSGNTSFSIVPQSDGWLNNYGLIGTYDETQCGFYPVIGLGWHYVVMTWDAANPGTIGVFVNGVKVGSLIRGSGESYNTDSGYVVANWGNNDRFFAGKVNQCVVYNRVLTDSEIEQNWLATKGRFGL